MEPTTGATGKNVTIFPTTCDARAQHLRDFFKRTFNQEPDYYVRVPGRVNLIGEHIDYCGYGVCPMALEQNVLLAVKVDASNPHRLHITNCDSRFEDYKSETDSPIEIKVPDGGPKWYQYVMCGIKGVQEMLGIAKLTTGLVIAVTGNVPHSAGLSSSSALVSAAVLAAAHSQKVELNRAELAEVAARCERHIGTQGGGMDQAIAFLATEGCAKLINFAPLRWRDLHLPAGGVFVVAHSMKRMNKAATADFNCRVMECRLATKVLAKRQNLDWEKLNKLKDLQEALSLTLFETIELVKRTLHKEPYTREEIMEELGVDLTYLDSLFCANTQHINSFKLHQRALHVYEEAQRVEKFYAAGAEVFGDGVPHVEILKRLGDLMNASHKSLRELYECSHQQLDRLVQLSSEIAFGARLTGAGWGGCIVALVDPKKVTEYMEKIQREFYEPMDVNGVKDHVMFVTTANAGACIFQAVSE